MIENKDSSTEVGFNLGGILSRRREELGLTINDVSEQLRLSVAQIKGLEDNNYINMPGSTYVRGYLRSYARLLNLDESLVIDEVVVDQEIVATEIEAMPVTRQLKMGDRWVKMGSIGLGLLFVGMLTSWWFENTADDQRNQSQLLSASPLGNNGHDKLQNADDITLNKVKNITVESVSPITPRVEIEATSEQKITTITNVKVIDEVKNNPSNTVDSQLDKALNSGVDSNQSANNIVVGSAGPDSEQLLITLKAPSWIDVRDTTNKKLLYERYKPGNKIELYGIPPFRVFVGTAVNVAMTYKGEVVDVESLRSGAFARFTLGKRR